MLRKSSRIWLLALGCAAWLFTSAAGGQTPAQKAVPAVESQAGSGKIRFEPGNRPDPFLNPLIQRKSKEEVDEEIPKGTPPPGIAGMSYNEVELLGMSVSPEGKTAVFRGNDKRVYFLREGDRLFDGYVKTITSDHVLLIRETKLRSGRVLTEEITKRLRT
jgi:hypothetical protein